jgi:hypothetical protein
MTALFLEMRSKVPKPKWPVTSGARDGQKENQSYITSTTQGML